MEAHAMHTSSQRNYFAVFGALMVMTTLTVAASTIELGPFNVVLALMIAATKAVLVLLFFMHLLHSNRLTWIVIAGAIYWVAIMIALTFSDYGASDSWPPPSPPS